MQVILRLLTCTLPHPEVAQYTRARAKTVSSPEYLDDWSRRVVVCVDVVQMIDRRVRHAYASTLELHPSA